MKKVFLLPVLLLGLSLVSCGSGSGSKSDFKDRKYVDELTNAEAAELLAEARIKLNDVSSISAKSNSVTERDNYKLEEVGEEKITVYSEGGAHGETKLTRKSTDQGVSYEHKEENVSDSFFDKKTVESVDHYYYMAYQLTDGEEMATGTEIPEAYYNLMPKMMSKSLAETYLGITGFATADAYELKDGSHEFVVSTITESHTGVEWGVGVKELITITRTQNVLTISKEGKITKAELFTESQRNRDSVTQAWYSSVKTVSKTTTSLEVKYDTKESGASRANELKSKIVGAMSAPELKVFFYAVVGETATPVGYAGVSLNYAIRTGINSFKVGYEFDAADMAGFNAVSFEASSSVLKAVPAEGESCKAKFAPSISMTGWSNKTLTVSDESVPMLVAGEGAETHAGLLEFDITASATGIVVSNVVLSLNY